MQKDKDRNNHLFLFCKKHEERPDKLNIPGGYFCVPLLFLVPSCGHQARVTGIRALCSETLGAQLLPIFVLHSPPVSTILPAPPHMPYLPSACPLSNTSWSGKPGTIYVCASWFHIHSSLDSYTRCCLGQRIYRKDAIRHTVQRWGRDPLKTRVLSWTNSLSLKPPMSWN